MSRTRVRRRRAIAVLLAGGVVGALSGPMANAVGIGRPEPSGARKHVVRPGDTLWFIATRFEPSDDPRVVVDAIASANGLDPGGLVPGQEIVIPPVG